MSCGCAVSLKSRESAFHRIKKICSDATRGSSHPDRLEIIAGLLLCKRWHQNQAQEKVAAWQRALRQQGHRRHLFSQPSSAARTRTIRTSSQSDPMLNIRCFSDKELVREVSHRLLTNPSHRFITHIIGIADCPREDDSDNSDNSDNGDDTDSDSDSNGSDSSGDDDSDEGGSEEEDYLSDLEGIMSQAEDESDFEDQSGSPRPAGESLGLSLGTQDCPPDLLVLVQQKQTWFEVDRHLWLQPQVGEVLRVAGNRAHLSLPDTAMCSVAFVLKHTMPKMALLHGNVAGVRIDLILAASDSGSALQVEIELYAVSTVGLILGHDGMEWNKQ